jgi:transcription antitermination factor NusG
MKWQFEGWCILRSKSRDTMRLAKSLEEDGFEVWTPLETRSIRIPRTNAKRKVRQPIMPSYIFAKAHQLIDLIQLANAAEKRRRGAGCRLPAHADFRVMHCFGGIPTVTDAALKELRRLEVIRSPKEPRISAGRPRADQPLSKGVVVRIEGGGSFDGLEGKVESSDCAQTVVFIGARRLKLPTCILSPASLSG